MPGGRPRRHLVGHGFGDLLALVCRSLGERGARVVAVEEYGHGRHRRIIRAHGLRTAALPVDGDGADVSRLEECGADAVLLTRLTSSPPVYPCPPNVGGDWCGGHGARAR